MAPQRRGYGYPSVGEPESVPLQTYGYKYSTTSTSTSTNPAPAPTPRPFPTHSASCTHSHSHCHTHSHTHAHTHRLKRSSTSYNHHSSFHRHTSSFPHCFTTLPNCIMLLAHSPKAHSKKSPSLSALPPRHLMNQRNASTLMRDGSMIPRLKSRPSTSTRGAESPSPSTPSRTRPATQAQSQSRPGILKKPTGPSTNTITKPKYDGLPATGRSVSLQPVPRPRPALFAPDEPASEEAPEPTTWTGTQHIRGETLVFTPEHERFAHMLHSRSPTNNDDYCSVMSRSSSMNSQPRTPYTPSVKRPTPNVISYFPPYEGSGMYDEEEEEQEEEVTSEQAVEGDGKNKTNHTRGSSIITLASSAIKAVFSRVSPTKTTIPLPEVDDPVKPDDQPEPSPKPRHPMKLVPIPTAEWPCGPSNDKRRRDDNEEDGENMKLYAVRREGPRNKDDPEPVEVVSDDEDLSDVRLLYMVFALLTRQSKPDARQNRSGLRLSLPPIDPRSWKLPAQPVQSPPVVGISSVTATAFPYMHYESAEPVSPTSSPAKPKQDTKTSEHVVSKAPRENVEAKEHVSAPTSPKEEIKNIREAPVTTFTLLRAGGLESIVKPIDFSHIPTLHRTPADTRTPNPPTTTSKLPAPSQRPSSKRPSTSKHSETSASSSSRPSSRKGDPTSKQSTRTGFKEGRSQLTSNSTPRKVAFDPRSPLASMPPPRGRAPMTGHYLFPESSTPAPAPSRSQSPIPPRSCMITPTPSESGPDEEEDMEQTPRAGRGGWIALRSDLVV